MKKLLSLVMALVMVLALSTGCILSGKIKAEDPSSISVLMKKVDKCQVQDEDVQGPGFKCLSIPPKDMTPKPGQSLVYLVVYKAKGEYGFGMYSANGFVIFAYLEEEKGWIMNYMGMAMNMTPENAAKNWAKWVEMLNEKYDLNKATCGMVEFPPVEPPKTSL